MDVALLPETPDQWKVTILVTAGIVGGGVLAYEAASQLQEGTFRETYVDAPKPNASVLALLVGIGLTGKLYNDLAKQAGWKPIVFGTAALAAVAGIGQMLRR